MFLNTTIMCRLMKQAYKTTGLKVGRSQERLYVAGSYWRFDSKPEFVPNKVKGLIIELCGEMPGIGEKFLGSKDGNQYEIGELEVVVGGYDTLDPIEITDLIVMNRGVPQRVLRNMTGDKLFLLNNVFVEIINNGELGTENGETAPSRPIAIQCGAFWENNVSRFHAMFRIDDDHNQLMMGLLKIDLSRDPVGEK